MDYKVGDLVLYTYLPTDIGSLNMLGRIVRMGSGSMLVKVISQNGTEKYYGDNFWQDLHDLRRLTKVESLNG